MASGLSDRRPPAGPAAIGLEVPVASSLPPPTSPALVPDGYGGLVDAIGVEVRTTRLRVARTANTELVRLYWRVGRLILDRQAAQPWGAKMIRQMAVDLRLKFPDMTGLSATNLQYMRAFTAAWRSEPISHSLWGHCRGATSERCWTS